ncbi:MAG: LPS export ABC transporter permease LptF [Desulfosudaceae bacterium]
MPAKPAIIDRYLAGQMLPYFAISIVVFTLIFLTHQLLDITDFIVNYHISLIQVLLMLLYSLPYFLELVIPIATMMAVLLVFLRMSGDNEILALRSGGVSVYRLLYPVAWFCLAAGLLTAFISMWALPHSRMAFEKMAYQAATTSPEIGIRERQFNTDFKDMTLYVGGYDKSGQRLTDIFIEDHQTVDTSVTISAPAGNIIFDRDNNIFRLILRDGVINQAGLADKRLHSISFKRYEVNLDIGQSGGNQESRHKDKKEMTLAELRDHIRSMDQKDSSYYPALLTWHKKFAIPFACLALGLLAVPLGLQSKNARASSGIGLSLLCFLAYYLMLSAGEILGESGRLPPIVGTWLPNLVMAGLGLALLIATAGGQSLKDFFIKPDRRLSHRPDGKDKHSSPASPDPDDQKSG